MFFFVLILLFLTSCNFSQNTKLHGEADSLESGLVTYTIRKNEYPLEKNSIVYSFVYFRITYDAPVNAVVISASVDRDVAKIEVDKETCHEYRTFVCDEKIHESMEVSSRDSILTFINLLKKSPPWVVCKENNKSKYEVYDAEVSFIDNQGFRGVVYGSGCNLPRGTDQVEARIRDYFFDIPIVKKIIPAFDFSDDVVDVKPRDLIYSDSILLEKNSIFFQLDETKITEKLVTDSVAFYRASLRNDSVEYVFNIRNSLGNLEKKYYVDGDVVGYARVKQMFDGFSTEEFKAQPPKDGKFRSIIFNDSWMKEILFSNLSETSNIAKIEREIREWFKSKITKSR